MGKRTGRPNRGDYKRFMILFSSELAEFLRHYCKTTGQPITRVVEEALTAYVPQMNDRMNAMK